MSEQRILMLGTGAMARAHAERFSLLPGCQLAAAVDANDERARDFAEAFRIPVAFGSLADAIAWGEFDAAVNATLTATEDLHQVKGEYEAARARTEQLTKQVSGMTHIMREKGINPNTPPGSVVPTVNGIVSQVRRSGGAQLVEVTIGADDGLAAGNTLEVSRGDKYLGRVEILQTSPDKSVGRIDRRFQTGQIREGDRVATRIQL